MTTVAGQDCNKVTSLADGDKFGLRSGVLFVDQVVSVFLGRDWTRSGKYLRIGLEYRGNQPLLQQAEELLQKSHAYGLPVPGSVVGRLNNWGN